MCSSRAAGALVVLVAAQLSVPGSYLPPVFDSAEKSCEIRPRRSFHCRPKLPYGNLAHRAALVVLVAAQLSVPGSYLPPVLVALPLLSSPPQTIISLPAQTAVCRYRASGALVVLVAAQLSVLGLYLPPVFSSTLVASSRPRRSFHCRPKLPCVRSRASGALVVLVAAQLSVPGSYIPASVHSAEVVISHRPRRSFHCRPKLPYGNLAHRAHWWCWWLPSYQCWDCISRPCSKRRGCR